MMKVTDMQLNVRKIIPYFLSQNLSAAFCDDISSEIDYFKFNSNLYIIYLYFANYDYNFKSLTHTKNFWVEIVHCI